MKGMDSTASFNLAETPKAKFRKRREKEETMRRKLFQAWQFWRKAVLSSCLSEQTAVS
jgi:hypothetical protein